MKKLKPVYPFFLAKEVINNYLKEHTRAWKNLTKIYGFTTANLYSMFRYDQKSWNRFKLLTKELEKVLASQTFQKFKLQNDCKIAQEGFICYLLCKKQFQYPEKYHQIVLDHASQDREEHILPYF